MTSAVEDLVPTFVLLSHAAGFVAGVIVGIILARVLPAITRRIEQTVRNK